MLCVALYTSAWIEIPPYFVNIALACSSHSTRVRGLKFLVSNAMGSLFMSHSTRVRGLKLLWWSKIIPHPSRTLHECVDWNTTNRRPYRQMTTSHSTRVRGLKWLTEGCSGRLISVALYTSAWIEIRNGPRSRRSQNVALYMSAWIEISEQTMILCSRNVALYTSAWIEISRIGKKTARIRSHSTRVRGLKWCKRRTNRHPARRRTLHECVDWNYTK